MKANEKKQEKMTLQAMSYKLRDILRKHAEGERVIRDMAKRIEDRAERSRFGPWDASQDSARA